MFQGNIESYSIKSDIDVAVDITYDEAGFVKRYMLRVPEFGPGTRAMLNNLKSKVISDVNVAGDKLLNVKFGEEITF